MMLRMFKSKIHRATITQADLHYKGSCTLDPLLIEAAGMLPYEEIHILNINTGPRFSTYIIEGERGKGECCLNGAAARLGQPGDLVILLTYAQMTAEEARLHEPTVVHVDAKNRITEVVHGDHAGIDEYAVSNHPDILGMIG
jgi:aspartate 1-decarboxylase